MNVAGIIAGASNVKGGTNPPFSVENFKTMYPQFFQDGKAYVPEPVLNMFIRFADAAVKKSRFHEAWEFCTCLFIAHFLTLYMQTLVDPELVEAGALDAQAVVAAGKTRGLVASKSVDGVSASFDFNTALQDLDGWAAWKLTEYGVQFATWAKLCSKGGMGIH